MIKIGEKYGQFLIKAEIGRGGMGTIYHAVDIMLNREVALKIIHPQFADDAQLMERFKIEAMTQARMNHPNIVLIFSFNKIDTDYVIAMEYVDGHSLKELLQKKRQLSIQEASHYVEQILNGLQFAHQHNVIHRDIKPANILITHDQRVKLSDFGIAKVFGSQGLTKTGMLVGTPWYTSPEQIVGKDVDFRADLYSLGITFYEMLTGRVPFDSDNNSEFQIQKAHLETPPARPSIYNAEIGLRLEKFILQALQKKVEKRFQNAAEMLAELRQLQEHVTRITAVIKGAKDVPKGSRPAKGRSRLRPLPIVILLFVVMAVAGLTFWKGGGWFKSLFPKKAAEPVSVQTPAEKAITAGESKGNAVTQQQGELGKSPAVTVPGGSTKSENVSVEATQKNVQPGVTGKPPGVTDSAAAEQKATSEQQNATPGGTPVSVDAEVQRLRSMLDNENLAEADQLAQELLQRAPETRFYPLLGRAKFMMNNFPEAEKLWLQALAANEWLTLGFLHRHEPKGIGCLGQLRFKKGILIFDSKANPSHSFVFKSENVDAIRKTVDQDGITITASINDRQLEEDLVLLIKKNRRDKEAFLVQFFNRYIL